nr:von Willebrand factor C and EGF domain-containing protein [Crassostrea gigas]
MIGLLLFLTVLATALAGKYHTGIPGEKPGRCSRSDVITDCLCPPGPPGCTSDFDCPYNLKCCSYGCGCRRECRAPDFSTGPQNGCFYNGRYYSEGQSFPAIDGCNTCFCSGNGQVGCTLIGCLDVCSQPLKPGGNCIAYFQRWWYNRATNECIPFIYGGCDGNENNFETRQACLQRCSRKKY